MKKNCFLFLILMMISIVGCNDTLQRPVFEYAISNPAGNGSRFPSFHQDQEGNLYLSWIANVEENIFMFRYSRYSDEGWHETETVHIGVDYFVHWADFASVVGREGQPIASHRYISPDNSEDAYQAELLFRDASTGRWGSPVNLVSDRMPARQGFVSLEPISADAVLAVWLEGGNAEELEFGEKEEVTDELPTLRSAIISADGEISMSRVIEEDVCGCCQNDLVATDRGYAVAYRRAAAADGTRDVRIAHFDTEYGEWSAPESVSRGENSRMQIEGCPADGPRADTNGEHTAVTWFAEVDGNASVHLARSASTETGFQDVLTVVETEHLPIGRADVLVTDSGGTYVSWMRQAGDNAAIMLTHIDAEGSIQETHQIGTTSASTSSGFPRMAKTEEAIVIAWTQTSPVFLVRTVSLPL